MCEVLDEMRKCNELRNYSALLGLIEEVQIMGNRMESSLGEKRDIERMHEEWHEMKAKLKKLRKEIKDTGGKDEEI